MANESFGATGIPSEKIDLSTHVLELPPYRYSLSMVGREAEWGQEYARPIVNLLSLINRLGIHRIVPQLAHFASREVEDLRLRGVVEQYTDMGIAVALMQLGDNEGLDIRTRVNGGLVLKERDELEDVESLFDRARYKLNIDFDLNPTEEIAVPHRPSPGYNWVRNHKISLL